MGSVYFEAADTDGLTIVATYRCAYRDCGAQPVVWFALAADKPDGWADAAPNASIGAYCSLEHALDEPLPTLDDAQAVYEHVADNVRQGYYEYAVPSGWQRCIANYPNPVPIVQMDKPSASSP